jgi:hypothetical protein
MVMCPNMETITKHVYSIEIFNFFRWTHVNHCVTIKEDSFKNGKYFSYRKHLKRLDKKRKRKKKKTHKKFTDLACTD